MHKFLKNIAASGLAVSLAAVPAIAASQSENAPTPDATMAAPGQPTPEEQDAAMQAWPADKQAAFKAWPAETQAYYWSLSQERQKMFWALSDSDKVRLSQMVEPQRESTWAQIESQVAPSQS